MGRFLKVLSAVLIIACGVSAQIWDIWDIGAWPNTAGVKATLTYDGTLTISGTGRVMDFPVDENAKPWNSVRDHIKRLIIEEGVTSIGVRAFSMLRNLDLIILPEGLTHIDERAFLNSGMIDHLSGFRITIILPEELTYIGPRAFFGVSWGEITIPAGVTYIGMGAFQGGGSQQTINVSPDNANYSSLDGVLFNKDKTTLIQYPPSRTGEYTIPSSVTSIGNNAFALSGVTSVTIGENVTSIGGSAFSNCFILMEITSLAVNPPTIGNSSTFFIVSNPSGTSVPTDRPLYVPCGSAEAYSEAERWSIFTNIVEIHDWSELEVIEEATCDTDGYKARVCARCGEETDIEPIEKGHDLRPVAAVPATCETDGKTAGQACNRENCDYTTGGEPIEKLGHDWGEWATTTAPSDTETGEERRDCQRPDCEEFETRQLGMTSILNATKSDGRMLFKQTIISDKMEIMLDERISFVVFDMTGNLVFNGNGRTWDLRNSAGRFVANGSYLVVVEAIDRNGRVRRYSAKIGVKR